MRSHSRTFVRRVVVALFVGSLGIAASQEEPIPLEKAAAEVDRDQLNERFGKVFTRLTPEDTFEKFSPLFAGSKAGESKGDIDRLNGLIANSNRNADKIFASKVDFGTLFLAALNLDLGVFENLANTVDEQAPLTLIHQNDLRTANYNLLLKARALSKPGAKVHVVVEVKTVKDGRKIDNCYVYYAPYYHDIPAYREKFDDTSSPTEDQIPHGKWWVWSERDGHAAKKATFHTDDRETRSITIQAP